MATISRQEYNNLFGPTVGDKIRLGDTDLYVEIEKDLREYGDEVVYGGGKTIRDGMGLANTMTSEEGALDLVITNVTIIDANLGVVKADVGVKDGKIAGIGKAGNPNIMHGVHPDLVTSTATDAISGEHLILTAAGIDGHVHMISPQQAYACLSNGITTLFGGGIGPTDGSNGTTITSGRWNIERMLESIEGLPVNVGLLGKGKLPRGVRVDMNGEDVSVDVSVTVDYGMPIQKVGRSAQENVRKSIESMTGLHVEKVDLHVVGVSFEKENEELQQSQKIALSLEAEEEQHALEEGKAAQETQAQERAEDEPTDEAAAEAADEPTEEDAGQEEESSEQA